MIRRSDTSRGGDPVSELLWLVPRLAQLIVRLALDPRVSGRTKSVLAALVVYLVSPVDLVPDFVPVLGYADDVLLEHWPGDARSLDRVCRIAGRIAGWVPRRWKARVFGSAAA